MRQFFISIQISAKEYQKLYAGAAHNVRTFAHDGTRIQFPASSLRQFVDRSGVNGSFLLTIDDDNKLRDIKRL